LTIAIVPVKTRQEFDEFIRLPWKIYGKDPNWVPQLVSEMRALLDEQKNPFWKHASKELFLAKKNGRTVGRVAAVIDRNYVSFQGTDTGFFSFFESENSVETAQALLSAVTGWLKYNKMTEMIGPTAPSTNDEMGFLLEGYDSSPFLMMPYNPPYYHELSVACGFEKAKDLYAYYMTRSDAPVDRLERLKDVVAAKCPGIAVRPVNMKDYSNEIKRIREVYNDAWEKNWGFVPWTEEEFYAQCAKLKPLVVPALTLLATIGDRPVGVLVGVPDYNEVLKRLNGKFGPIEILKFLWFSRKIHRVRVMIMGVVKEFRNKGIEGLLYREIIREGPKRGYNDAEFSWILEDNTMMCRAAEMLGGRLYKKYRVYRKGL
jgi:GNAT superfamily N-acetyltransferase